jgi:hypothetical protein
VPSADTLSMVFSGVALSDLIVVASFPFLIFFLIKEYLQCWSRLYDITWFVVVYAQRFMKSVIFSKPGFTSITCPKIGKTPYS